MHAMPGEPTVETPLLWRPLERWRTLVRLRREQFERLRGPEPGRGPDDYWRRRVANYYGAVRGAADERRLVGAVRAACEVADAGRRAAGRPGRASLLDVGGGFGAVAVPVARAGFLVTVVEPSAAMREYLGRWATEEGVGGRLAVVPEPWPTPGVDVHDVVLCAHVLYPIEDVGPFVSRLAEAAGSSCLLAMRLRPAEIVPDSLFRTLHAEPRVPQPTFADLLAVLGELDLSYQATTFPSPSTWSFADLDEAEESLAEMLLVFDRPDARARVRDWAATTLQEVDGRLAVPGRESIEGVATIAGRGIASP